MGCGVSPIYFRFCILFYSSKKKASSTDIFTPLTATPTSDFVSSGLQFPYLGTRTNSGTVLLQPLNKNHEYNWYSIRANWW